VSVQVVTIAGMFTLASLMMTAGLLSLLFGRESLPPRIQSLNDRVGWPGRNLSSRKTTQVATIVFGVLILLVIEGIAVDAILNGGHYDLSLVDRTMFVIHVAVSIAWTGYLLRWRRAQDRRETASKQTALLIGEPDSWPTSTIRGDGSVDIKRALPHCAQRGHRVSRPPVATRCRQRYGRPEDRHAAAASARGPHPPSSRRSRMTPRLGSSSSRRSSCRRSAAMRT